MQERGVLSYGDNKMYEAEQVTMSQKQSQNGNVISDIRFVTTKTKGGNEAMGMRQKIMDFLYYSAVQGTDGDDKSSCSDVCGKGIFSQKCCASVVTGPEYWFVCVDRSITAADMTMNVAGANVAITCVESKAMKIAASISAFAALAVATI